MDYLYVVLGLAVLIVGGEGALRGAIGLAERFGVSKAVIGVTVIGFGSSAPELTVTVKAVLANSPDIAIGNVVGSNIANILLILGVGGLIYPLSCAAGVVRRDGNATVLAVALLVALGWYGVIVAWHGVLMLAMLVGYMVWSVYRDRQDPEGASLHEMEASEAEGVPDNIVLILAYALLGIAGLVGGAWLLVHGAVGIAREYGVPESIIGLSLVAVGTSLPELAATVVAVARGHTEVAIGNILGSCIFNVLCILGVTVLIAPLPIAADIRDIDMWVMLAAVFALWLMLRDTIIVRWEAALLLLGYVAYIGNLLMRWKGGPLI